MRASAKGKGEETMSMARRGLGWCVVALVVSAVYCTGVWAEGTGSKAVSGDEPVTVDSKIPNYAKAEGVSGNLNSIGSDTLNNLMTLWAEEFRKVYPNVNIQIEGKGSATAPPALIKGTAQLGPMSRLMKPEEMDAFEKAFGYKPTAIPVAVDALAVFVNKDNPIQGLSFGQLDAIFSHTCLRKEDPITKWKHVGLNDNLGKMDITLYGRNSSSGTYLYFKEHVLKKGDYKNAVKEQPGSAAVVQSVAGEINAIGYSGIGYKTAGVRTVALKEKDDGPYVEATAPNCYNGTYPLARYLYINVNKAPGKPLDPLVCEFLKFVLSQQGQGVVVKDGYFPVLSGTAEESLGKLK
jgi:phosphate transport system substrate-binding protein